jgi:hypothetical protein
VFAQCLQPGPQRNAQMDVRLRCLKRFSECTCGLFCLLMVYGFTSAFPETLISFPRFLFRVLHRCKSSDFDWRLTFHKNSSQHRSSKLLQLKAVLADPCCEHRMNDAEPEWAKQRRYTLQTSRPKVSICLNHILLHPITSYLIPSSPYVPNSVLQRRMVC